MKSAIESVKLIKLWQKEKKEICIRWQNNNLECLVSENGKQQKIPFYHIEGIPKIALQDPQKLEKFLADTHIQLNLLSNGEYKLRISPTLKGGANTFDPQENPELLWPNAIVYYEIDTTKYPVAENERKIILAAIDDWNNMNAGYTFMPRTDAFDPAQKDYLIFGEETESCYSYVGRLARGGQYLRCDLDGGVGFNKGSILHEMGHAIGLYHEHQRLDRDDFVIVNGGSPNNYGKQGKPFENYDFDSNMHYPVNVRLTDGQTLFLNPNVALTNQTPRHTYTGGVIGTSQAMSATDIAAIQYLAGFAKNPQTFKDRAQQYENQKNAIKAIEYYEIANRVSKAQDRNDDAYCLFKIAQLQNKIGRTAESIGNGGYSYSFLTQRGSSSSLFANPSLPNSPYAQKLVWQTIKENAANYFNAEDYQQALHHYTSLISEYEPYIHNQSEIASWHSKCGYCAYKLEQWYLALEHFEQALSLAPNNETLQRNIAKLERKLDENQQPLHNYYSHSKR